MPAKCCWVIYGSWQADQRTQSSSSPSSFINHSTLLLDRALKRQAPCLYMHSSTRQAQNASTCRPTRRRGNHMHDHSRFQRDVDDVTGVSLSLYYYSQKSLTHNIGNASALPIINLRVYRLTTETFRKGNSHGEVNCEICSGTLSIALTAYCWSAL